jgi:hypothetical protein
MERGSFPPQEAFPALPAKIYCHKKKLEITKRIPLSKHHISSRRVRSISELPPWRNSDCSQTLHLRNPRDGLFRHFWLRLPRICQSRIEGTAACGRGAYLLIGLRLFKGY